MNISIAKKIYDLGMLKKPNRLGSIAEARIAIIEHRVKLNGKTVYPIIKANKETGIPHAIDPILPNKSGSYTLELHDLANGQTINRVFQI